MEAGEILLLMFLLQNVSKTSMIVALFGLLDLALTIILVESGFGTEANPLMRQAQSGGWIAFAFAKCLSLLVFIGVFTHLRTVYPRIAPRIEKTCASIAIIGYFGVFTLINI